MTVLSLEQIFCFLPAAITLTVTPGPDILMVLSLSMSKGRHTGIAFGVGAASACMIQAALLALGITWAVRENPTLFLSLKIVGGLYLLWLGIQALRSARCPAADPAVELSQRTFGGNDLKLFLKGMFANLTNPKVVIFFISFLPQFVNMNAGGQGWQMIQLGILFSLQASLIFALTAFFAGGLRRFLVTHPRAPQFLDYFAGGVFILLALSLVFLM